MAYPSRNGSSSFLNIFFSIRAIALYAIIVAFAIFGYVSEYFSGKPFGFEPPSTVTGDALTNAAILLITAYGLLLVAVVMGIISIFY